MLQLRSSCGFTQIFLALMIAAGLAFVTTNPGRGEESPAYAIEVSDVTAKIGERGPTTARPVPVESA